MNDKELQQKMIASQNVISERAIHPDTHLIYGKVNLEDPQWWQNTVFPSPESIGNRFCDDSETPNVSNCAIAGGRFLGALVDCYDVTGDSKYTGYAQTIFDGLRTLSRVSPRKGFIARCVLPCDGKTHLLNSSVDQYTYYVYGLYKYYHSPMCGKTEKQDIEEIMNDICTMIESDGAILATNGIPAPVSDIEAIRSDRSSRLLEMYLVGDDITGNEHWRDKYYEKLKESNYARLYSILDPKRIRHPYLPRDKDRSPHLFTGAVDQTQYSLVPLFELETDLTVKAVYLEAMRINAAIYESRPNMDAHGMEIILLAQNRFLVAPETSPTDKQKTESLVNQCRDILSKSSKSNMNAVAAYWFAVKGGWFKYEP